MQNILLGKTLKAMYKLSGKTLTQLSEESDLTLDTINNLFYARIQKPGFTGVNALTRAMGFRPQDLIDFLELHRDLPDEADVTELFTKYISSAQDTKPTAAPAKPAPQDLLREQYERQLSLMKENSKKVEDRYEHEIAAIREAFSRAEEHSNAELRRARKIAKVRVVLITLETLAIIALLVIDILNSNIGWFR